MKFPVTREQLQAYTHESYEMEQAEEEIQKKLSGYVQNVCSEFSRNLLRDVDRKKFVWFGLHLIPSSPEEIYLQQFITTLRELFIGCTVTADETRSYLIINWS
jgi:hypothetical protein